MKAKTSCHALHSTRLALLCLSEDRRRLGIKNKFLIYFVLHSACTIFAV